MPQLDGQDADSKLQLNNEDEDVANYGEEEADEEVGDEAPAGLAPISDKFFYKEMAKIKEKSKTTGSGVLPPKKSASAYIIFQKEVSFLSYRCLSLRKLGRQCLKVDLNRLYALFNGFHAS